MAHPCVRHRTGKITMFLQVQSGVKNVGSRANTQVRPYEVSDSNIVSRVDNIALTGVIPYI